ncbi:hypothetical protein ACHAWU_000533 [Discostella pseudostelligera]|uniref:Methyltransferase domain-containing protein n=1 Tax=Discostella pseudostelligera TaxID=259834 RepID=A0ABD3M709_9STRA
MGLTDELEALRQSGSVKSKSAGLSAAAATTTSTAFITPEAEAERRRNKALQEKQSRLEAKNALHSNNYYGEDDLNSILLNKKLIEEQRSKKKEAERNLREWRRKHHDGGGGGGGVGGKTKGTAAAVSVRSDDAGDDDDEEDDHEARMNRDALEMLPEHVVRTLKAKYETSNAELALERALQEEEVKHGHGKAGALAKLMEITLEEDDDDEEEEDVGGDDEGEKKNAKDDDDEPQQQQQPLATEAADEEWVKIEQKVDVEAKGETELKEQVEEEKEEEEQNGAMGNKVAVAVGVAAAVAAAAVAVVAATTTASNPTSTNDEPQPVEVQVEEVREKIEHLTIDEGTTPCGEEKENASVIINVDNDSGAVTTNRDNKVDEETKEHHPSDEDDDNNNINNTTLPSENYDRQIEQTKRFYNLHSQEYIEHTSNKNKNTATTTTETTMDNKNLSSSSSSHRDAFIAHILKQQQKMMDHSTNSNPTITISSTTSTSSSPSLLLLDLGCGYGRDTYHFTTTLGHRVLGIDFSIEMLHHAKRLAPLAHYLNMDMRHLKNALVDESLDGIWANSSLLHLPKVDMLNVLQGLYGAMKVGGVLFMSLKMRDAESTVDEEEEEVFEIDERYVARNSLPPPASVDADAVAAGENLEGSNDDDDTRRKFYSYYTLEEVRELVAKSGWTILEINEEDHRGVSDYVEHTKVYVFATRSNE